MANPKGRFVLLPKGTGSDSTLKEDKMNYGINAREVGREVIRTIRRLGDFSVKRGEWDVS